jgi:SAM-dependent methyltransferase
VSLTARSRPAAHFQRLYGGRSDPWHYRSSPYERAKFRHTVAALGGRRFAAALEVGCSIGVLTRQLAPHCAELLGIDAVPRTLAVARRTCAGLAGVRFRPCRVPADWPAGRFDLIVLSEVLYFLAPADLARLAGRVLGSLVPGGLVLLVNWTGVADDPLTGDAAVRLFRRRVRGALHRVRGRRAAGYRLDLLRAARHPPGQRPA